MASSTRKTFNLGWKSRHLLVLVLSVALVYLFLVLRAQWSDMHRWNRALADASLLMIAASMMIGPLVRLSARFRPLLPWRRELGIYGVILLFIHSVIILVGWVEWDLMRLIGFEIHPSGVYVMFQKGFGIGNIIGIIALVYGIVLALSSSDWSQRMLGGPTWKFLQQSAYVLWMLIVVHTAYFLYIHFQDFHRSTPEPNIMQMPFAVLVGLVSLLQFAAFVKTWRQRKSGTRVRVEVQEA
jgi:methionine sulfoxide reductase heme-binding subunit